MKLRHIAPLFALTLSCAAFADAAPSDKELQQFVAASVEVNKINSASLAKREAASTAAAAEKLEDDATAQMEKAIEAKSKPAFIKAGSGSDCTAGSPTALRITAGSNTRAMRVTSRAVRK